MNNLVFNITHSVNIDYLNIDYVNIDYLNIDYVNIYYVNFVVTKAACRRRFCFLGKNTSLEFWTCKSVRIDVN